MRKTKIETYRGNDEAARRQAEDEARRALELWGPGGLFWDPADPLCQEVVAQLKKKSEP